VSGIPPNVQPPTPDEIQEAAARHRIDLSDGEVENFAAAIEQTLEGYERLDELPEPSLDVEYTDRDPGYRPGPEGDPLNAVVRRCRVEGADPGPLSGTRAFSRTTSPSPGSR